LNFPSIVLLAFLRFTTQSRSIRRMSSISSLRNLTSHFLEIQIIYWVLGFTHKESTPSQSANGMRTRDRDAASPKAIFRQLVYRYNSPTIRYAMVRYEAWMNSGTSRSLEHVQNLAEYRETSFSSILVLESKILGRRWLMVDAFMRKVCVRRGARLDR
jgi:hypothetical protein